ncbi:MAG TPA: serine/threonine-protein kinase [Polyangiaceae bacterium]|nr:serine/threonine-protein kinase [Polyangiaceae bacterium]
MTERQHSPAPALASGPNGHPAAGSLADARFGTYFLGDYRVVDEIGIGGMASVHLARKDGAGGFQKWVAIKRIHPHLVEDDQFIHMFLDEARIAALISHANVAQVFDLGEDGGTYWIAMEYLHGEPLREVMRAVEEGGPRMGFEIASRIIADACEGLHAAHDLRGKNGEPMNLVHRDVTPHNLFVTYEGTTKVVDFGIAKVAGRLSSTRAGTLKGKLAYMAPEQVRGQEIDRRTDIFALGVVLWELTTGQRLFRMDSDLETLEKVQACQVQPPSTLVEGYPSDLEAIALKALAKDRDKRFQTAREFSRALQQFIVRRGALVGPEEVATYVRSIFVDRIQKRDDHLRWAAEVTQTINIDALQALPSYTEIEAESASHDSADLVPPHLAQVVHAPAHATGVRSPPRPGAAAKMASGPVPMPAAPPSGPAKMPTGPVPMPSAAAKMATGPVPLPPLPGPSNHGGDDDDDDNVATVVVASKLLTSEYQEAPGYPHSQTPLPSVVVNDGPLRMPAETRTAVLPVGPPLPVPGPGMSPYPATPGAQFPPFPGAPPPFNQPPFPMPSAPPHQYGGDHGFLQAPAVVTTKPSLAETVRVRRPTGLGAAPPIWLVALAVLALTGVIVVLVLMLLQGRGSARGDESAPGAGLESGSVQLAALFGPEGAGSPGLKPKKPAKPEPKPEPKPDTEPAEIDIVADGYLSVQCVPSCTAISAEKHELGPSPVVRAPLPPGTYRLMLKGNGKTKVVEVAITSGQSSPLRVSME